MRCASCGFESPDGFRFCRRCAKHGQLVAGLAPARIPLADAAPASLDETEPGATRPAGRA